MKPSTQAQHVMLLWATLISVGALAQLPTRTPTPNDTLQSPRVLTDKRVMIQIYAPKADEVTVGGDFLSGNKPLSLTKNEQGVWSVLIGPLRPDYYAYTLTVDGVRTMDPKNPIVKQGISSLENMMAVPGPETGFEDNRSVPHGEVREVWYPSNTLGMLRRMHVYTPPGYEKGTDKYPVFYLLHGGGDDDSGWNTIGRSGFILDNLIAAGKAKPMIVVMPNGSMPLPAQTGMPDAQTMNRVRDLFSAELLKEIMPTVEKNYRSLTTPQNRAIAGLSMGGFQTLDVTLTHPELFNYVGVFSSGFFGAAADEADSKYAKALNDPAFNKGKKLFWIGIGKDDFVMESNKKTLALLDKHQIKYQYKESTGGHTWINWRQYLNEYTPLLFR
ncbi:esterase [Spirosoma utsteinense]|uniref:Enterochelin esterase family protein n=1 Tax=Spirosoma utsteinense TaxID=2585773 RepID=A0ABR6W532_9BACT|nr:esterase [Spirosoma utsteinense]MBC3785509.1 enterochelin esterase family protein [Spirosoma utsteinense]MBC3791658.1 enterochelin esterase family protein [Spirosoma utsteinense]